MHHPGADHCREVGTGLARLHLASRGFEKSRANNLSLSGWRSLFDACAPHADDFLEGLGTELRDELATLEAEWPKSLPKGVIHADLFPDNVFFLGSKLSGVIDFYFACNDFFAYDIAVCLNAWCFEADKSFNVTKAHNMLAAYRAVRPLSDDELEALPLLARGAAMRFLLTTTLRLAEPGRRRAREGQGPARISLPPALPPQRNRPRRLRASVMAASQTVDIYTDGACSGNPGPGGWGALLKMGDREKELWGGDRRDHQQPHGNDRRDRGAEGP